MPAPVRALVAGRPVRALWGERAGCSPNTLLTDDGRWSGHVDLRALGTADRWADLAVTTWSTEWNYGPAGDDDPLLDAYGIAPDPERAAYYQLRWDLTP